MNNLAKIWDFVWGTLLVGMLPMFAFVLGMMFIGVVRPEFDGSLIHKFFLSFAFVTSFVAPFATLYFVCRWRQKHRLLPASLLILEVLLGLLLAGVAFFFTVAFWGFASLN